MFHVVSIKGNMAEAILAANQYAIVLHNPTKHPKFNEVIAYVDHECLPELYQWHSAPVDFEARDAAPGTLLWFDGAGQAYNELWSGPLADADDIEALKLVRALDAAFAGDAALIRGLNVTCR